MAATYDMESRPAWPRRAIVTAGEPYGNKGLHFGHVGGVFVPADFFARFLRDRLGRENVIFTSGTDCYGSPIMESYRKLRENELRQEHQRIRRVKSQSSGSDSQQLRHQLRYLWRLGTRARSPHP